MTREEREAAEWVARMRGSPTEADREAFRAWHAKAAHAAAFTAAEDDFALSGTLSRQRIEAKTRARQAAPVGVRWALATMAAAGLTIGYTLYLNRQSDTAQLAAGPMLPGQLRLADGTTLSLMDGAWAEPRFSKSERRLRLHGGRARFIVAHDSTRPFIVIAGVSETKALGTVFEVDARSDVPKIKLVTGAVEVRLSGTAKAIRLVPGESAEVSGSGPRRIPIMHSPVPSTVLATDGLPLGAVIEAANEANRKPIRLADPALATLPVTGRFDIADSASLARKLSAALDLTAEEQADAIVLRAK